MRRMLWLAAAVLLLPAIGGCSGSDALPPAPQPSPAPQAAYPPTPQGARALLERLGLHGDPDLIASLRPTASDYQALFEPDFAARAQSFYEARFWASMPATAQPWVEPDRTEVRVWGATTEELRAWKPAARNNFPGGYRKIKDFLRPGFTIYSAEMVAPGDDYGTTFNGLAYVNGHWAYFPKPWYVLDSPQR
ncbi:hypothetical protein [Actinoplanes teichomyceticus]|nr:hypothetical protein [Actinoplanes teichomyceticus]